MIYSSKPNILMASEIFFKYYHPHDHLKNLYSQTDGVAISNTLASIFPNIYMANIENQIVHKIHKSIPHSIYIDDIFIKTKYVNDLK